MNTSKVRLKVIGHDWLSFGERLYTLIVIDRIGWIDVL